MKEKAVLLTLVAVSTFVAILAFTIASPIRGNPDNLPYLPRDGIEYHPIFIHHPTGDTFVSCFPSGGVLLTFFEELTSEQLLVAFPNFEHFAPLINNTTATFLEDGTMCNMLIELDNPSINPQRNANNTTISINRKTGCATSYDCFSPYDMSSVHGITVAAVCHGSIVEANFLFNDVFYRITIREHLEPDQRSPWLELLVNEIIYSDKFEGKTADPTLVTPQYIPEILHEKLTLEQAYNDPDFGAYIPKIFTEDEYFRVHDVERYIHKERNELTVYYYYGNAHVNRWWTVSEVFDRHQYASYPNAVFMDDIVVLLGGTPRKDIRDKLLNEFSGKRNN
jgi:hypothetical protein